MLSLAAVLFGGTIAANRFFIPNSRRTAENLENNDKNPMAQVRKLLRRTIDRVRRDGIFCIEDLDRCDPEYVMDLLEEMKTIIRIAPELRERRSGGDASFVGGRCLAEIGATASIGTVGDSYDNALAETVNGYYTTELVRGPARPEPWKTVEDLELATLGWVHWHNTQRLHGYLGAVPPASVRAGVLC